MFPSSEYLSQALGVSEFLFLFLCSLLLLLLLLLYCFQKLGAFAPVIFDGPDSSKINTGAKASSTVTVAYTFVFLRHKGPYRDVSRVFARLIRIAEELVLTEEDLRIAEELVLTEEDLNADPKSNSTKSRLRRDLRIPSAWHRSAAFYLDDPNKTPDSQCRALCGLRFEDADWKMLATTQIGRSKEEAKKRILESLIEESDGDKLEVMEIPAFRECWTTKRKLSSVNEFFFLVSVVLGAMRVYGAAKTELAKKIDLLKGSMELYDSKVNVTYVFPKDWGEVYGKLCEGFGEEKKEQ